MEGLPVRKNVNDLRRKGGFVFQTVLRDVPMCAIKLRAQIPLWGYAMKQSSDKFESDAIRLT